MEQTCALKEESYSMYDKKAIHLVHTVCIYQRTIHCPWQRIERTLHIDQIASMMQPVMQDETGWKTLWFRMDLECWE